MVCICKVLKQHSLADMSKMEPYRDFKASIDYKNFSKLI